MSRGRFGLLLGLLTLAVATVSFGLVLTVVLDDDPGGDARATTTTTTTTTTAATAPTGLVTPTFVVVVSSEVDEAAANQLRDELTESGYDAGVLRSEDYPSLEPGFFVAYTGPFADVASAEGAKAQLVGDGYTAAYSRCVGSIDQCPS